MRHLAWLTLAFATGCTPPTTLPAPTEAAAERTVELDAPSAEPELEPLLRTDPELSAMLDDAARRRIQVLVAVPTKDESGTPTLLRVGYRADAEYFYPASAVKLGVVVAALEKLDELRGERHGRDVGLSTTLRVTEGEGPRRKTFETTLRDEITNALVVSDNESHNRLFELVGQDDVAERLTRLGLSSTRLVHYLADTRGERAPSAFEMLPRPGASILVAQRVGFELPPAPSLDGLLVGNVHVDETGHRVDGPMDFAQKNRMSLHDLQALLVSIMRPDLSPGPAPRIAPSDREALVAILEMLPSELRGRDRSRAQDDRHKPLRAAIMSSLPDHRVRVYGKGGRAYGFVVESSYVVDETTGRSLFVTAAIYANENEMLNDDRYEYAAVADPFITRLGHVLAHKLLMRPRRRDR